MSMSQGAPVVIVRNKIDTLDGGYEGQASLDLGQQVCMCGHIYILYITYIGVLLLLIRDARDYI